MANTLAIKPLNPEHDIVLERMRSTDFDPVVVWEFYGDVVVLDETDGGRVLYALTDSGRTNRFGDRIVRVDDEPEAEGGALWHARRRQQEAAR